MVNAQITRAMQSGYRRFNMYNLEKYDFSCELIDDYINVILVEKNDGYHEPDICTLSTLYFSRECEFLRFLVGKQQYLKVAQDILGLEDTQRLLEVNKAML